jgi:excisionase family DNA binding protein
MSDLLTVRELCEWLKVLPSWVYVRTYAGSTDPIPHVKAGRLLRFDRAEVEQWLRRHRFHPTDLFAGGDLRSGR